jgi:glycine/D-amino acid oxidase-like deaminating enzyme
VDLKSSTPFWLINEGMINAYPSIDKNTICDVVIMGGGITGAIISYHLTGAGIEHLVIDKRHIGMGSTSASTALLQYEIDTPLHELAKKIPLKDAVRSYLRCEYAIDAIAKIAEKVQHTAFEKKASLQFASYKSHVKNLETEYKLRQQHKISHITWLDKKDLKDKFGIDKHAAILSNSGGSLDPYQFTHTLLKRAEKAGNRVYGNSEVQKLKHTAKGVKLTTTSGHVISCKKLIIAAGYESQKYISKQVEKSNSTFAIISEPIQTTQEFWHKNCLVWETAKPYLYLRTTADKRIIIGGKDVETGNGKKRDRLMPHKSIQLEQEFKKLFPHIPFKTDFAWSGFFGSTKDGLPYIGKLKERPHTYFALGFGGNGITFSLLAAEIIRDDLQGKKNKDERIFSFDR